MESTPIKLLLVGPLPPPLGGATVLFRQLGQELGEFEDLVVTTIDTAPKSAGLIRRLWSALRIVFEINARIRNSDVLSFHASIHGAVYFSPVLNLLAKMYRKPWVFRGFGGGYAEYYRKTNPLGRFLIRRGILAADHCLLETKALVSYFDELNYGNIHWHPNSRPIFEQTEIENKKRTGPGLRCVYVGHIKESKGVLLLINAIERLQPNVHLDVYGTFSSDFPVDVFTDVVSDYKGELSPDQVLRTMTRYDVLILPTFYEGEGYPGVILEAFSVGIPVVATNWRAIPELFADGNSGILVDPNNEDALLSAIQSLSESSTLRDRLSIGAKLSGEEFDSKKWTACFAGVIRSCFGE